MTIYREREAAFAKINFFLHIDGQREDGYHLISSLMQTVSLCDEIEIEASDSASADRLRPGICLSSDSEMIPLDSRNTAHKAARLFLNRLNRRDIAIHIRILKRIPSQAGMGGGSADAAAVLRMLARIFPGAVSGEDLLDLAVHVGADVPFCLSGGTAYCEGIGDILTPVAPLSGLPTVIVKPSVSVSTPWAFARFDEGVKERRAAAVDREAWIPKTEESPAEYISSRAGILRNDLEPIVEGEYPDIRNVREFLAAQGAVLARMSGSGSSVFGIFASQGEAEEAFFSCRERFGNGYFCALTATITQTA